MSQNGHNILIFTDGACSGNPGPGGWAAIIVNSDQVIELGDQRQNVTNNQMELTAAIKALEYLEKTPSKIHGETTILTDSSYVIHGITKWIYAWMKKQWKTTEGSEVANRDLWEALFKLVKARPQKITWKYVPGHSGVPGNTRVDFLAVEFSKHRNPDLYHGPLSEYPVQILSFPKENSIKKNKTAHSYLSLVEGVVARHSTWSECEKRVKGRRDAKFKKAMNEEEEKEILRQWGHG